MHLIEQIGSYAGLAAIPGLAVLAALYFSQARDVRRLRDWAGRAPERAAEQAVGGRAPGQPVAAAQPAAAATPAAAAAAKPAAATPAAAATGAKPATAAAATTGKAATPAGAAAGKAAAAAGAGAAGAGAAASGGAATGTVARPGPPAVGGARPGVAAASGVRRPIPRVPSSQTSILTPTTPERDRWYRRAAARLPAGRYIALIVAGILVLGGGAAYALTQLGGNSGTSTSQPAASSGSSSKSTPNSSKHGGSSSSSTVSPSSVTVTVVNGTSTPNLARDTATKLSGFGFQIGNKVTGTGTLAAAESVVEYKPGSEAEARLVADKLHINQKQPADADALAQAGPAGVIVVLGADQAPGG